MGWTSQINKGRQSIAHQAALRLIFSLGLFVVLLGFSSYELYSLALHKSAEERTLDLATFYGTRLMQLDRDWELQARDFKVRLEVARLLEENKNRQVNLQAFMTVQGTNRRFQYLLIQDSAGHKVFDFSNSIKLDTIPLPPQEESGWYFARDAGTLYRVFVVPIWLGDAGTGSMAVFYEINNALLFNLATPGIVLTAMHNGNAISSSAGQTGLEQSAYPAREQDTHGGDIPWSTDGSNVTLLHIDAPIKVLFTTTELAIGAATIPIIDGLVLWFTLGFWLMHNTRRIKALGEAVGAFSEQQLPTSLLKEKISAAYGEQPDEIREVADAITNMAVDIQQRDAERMQSEAELRIAAAAFESQEGMIITDANSVILRVNTAFTEMTRYAPGEIIGQKPSLFKSEHYDQDFYRAMWSSIIKSGLWQGEIWCRHKNGNSHPKWLSISSIKDEKGQVSHYIGTYLDLSHQKAAEAAEAARKVAEAASRAKSEFLSSMSHELRTPLNAVLGFSQLLDFDTGLPANARENAREIIKAGTHLLALINDLIDLARIEAGKMDLALEELTVKTAIAESLAIVAPIARKSGIELINTCAHTGEAKLTADRVRLRQVLINLLSNAIKYNKPQGKVSISCNIMNKKIHISVADTGLGIPAEKQPRVFNAFDRLGEEMGTIEGAGIGLVITKRIVEAMGGSVGFESAEGHGSTFWVEFDMIESSHTPLAVQISDSSIPGEISQSTSPSVVLYVEDNPLNLRLMKQIFAQRKNWELHDAHTAELGIELARAAPPSLILMDINLPGMDGYTALTILRADPATAHIPVIAVSANVMKGDKERGLAAGFHDYITKPIDIPSFYATLDRSFNPSAS